MSESAFQVIAQAKDGTVSKSPFSGALFHIGSAPHANLKLTGDDMPAIALRLQPMNGSGVLVTNLYDSTPTPLLDNLSIPAMESKEWKPGQIIKLGDYTLRLEQIVSAAAPTPGKAIEDLPTVRPGNIISVSTQPSAPPSVPSTLPEAVDEGATADEEPQIAARSNEETQRPSKVPEVSQFIKVHAVQDEQATAAFTEGNLNIEDKEFATAAYHGTIDTLLKEIDAAPRPDFNAGYTLRKDWQEVGRLSAQLGLQSINFMPGERIVIPVSIRNDYTHDVQLLISGAGIPLDWKLISPVPVNVKNGQVQAVDLVLETHPTAVTNSIEAVIRLYDQVTSSLAINLPLTMILKRHPDMIGQLEPISAHEHEPIYLTLRNHTLAKTDVFISGQSESSAIRVVIPQPKAELPPSQTLRIPIRIEVLKRPRLFDAQHPYQLAVQQGTRAPLNYAGKIRVRPALGYLPVFLIIILGLLAIGAVTFTAISYFQGRFVPIPTATATPTAVIPSPTAVPIVPAFTPEFVPSPEPILPTELPFTDPRTTSCQAQVSIPDGWKPYQVVTGDRLFRLAIRTGTTVNEILRVNCLTDPSMLFPGQMLLLPG